MFKHHNDNSDASAFVEDDIFRTIGQVADVHNIPVYVVGGYVRDQFLGKVCKDIDIVVVGDGPEFAKKVAHTVKTSSVSIYRRFGTAMIRYRDLILEFVGARRESYRPDSRKPEVKSADLITDLSRRDFTINAMAISLNGTSFGQLEDPFDGLSDIRSQRIRTPLAPKKTFHDDPLRIMRAVRFACQLDFDVEKRTKAGLASEAERLKIISQERITDELLKILTTPEPSIGLRLMEETGIMPVVLPDIHNLKGVDQIGTHRHKDVFDHTLKVVDNVASMSDDIKLRVTALFHDIAKPATKAYHPDSGWSFHGHEEIGARMFKSTGRRLRLSNDMIDYVVKLIRLHLRPIHLSEEGVTDSAIRRLVFNAGDHLDDLITLCRADITSGNPKRVKKHLANFDHVVQRIAEVEEKDRIRQFQPPVRGDEIMRELELEPGPVVGKIKNAIQEAILNGDIPNEHDAAFDYMMRIKDRFIKE